MGPLNVPFTGDVSKGFNVPNPAAARSRAIPLTPKQSALSGVIAISITGSSKPANVA